MKHLDPEQALRVVREAKTIVYDVESTGLHRFDDRPVGFAIYDPSEDAGAYVATHHAGGGNVPDGDRYVKALVGAMGKRKGTVVGHNIKFDMHMSANVGIWMGACQVQCTLNAQALCDEYTKSYSLENLAKDYGVEAKKSQAMYEHLASTFGGAPTKEQMARFHELPGNDDMAVEYAIGDCVTTWGVAGAQHKIIEAQELTQVALVEMELIPVLFKMERRGIRIDVDAIEPMREKIEAQAAEAAATLPEGLNMRSPKQMLEWVKSLGRSDWPTTAKGNPSFPKAYLETFPEGQRAVEVRELTNLVNTFINPLAEEHVREGRVHPEYNQNKMDEYGTVSGRLSSSRPNIQQVPKHNRRTGKVFRRLFVPDEGWVLGEMDWSQAEPRLFAHYSKDPTLVKAYTEPPFKDIHTVVAEYFDRDRKTTAKRMNMGMLTGMGKASFAGHMGMSLDEATELWMGWYRLFPGIRAFQDQAKRAMLNRGYVRTLLKRRGRLEESSLAYKAVSRIIQGGNADLMKYKLIEMDRICQEGGGVSLLATIHDSVMFQREPDYDMARLKEAFEDVQGPPFNLRVPFVADVGEGCNWSEASYGEGWDDDE